MSFHNLVKQWDSDRTEYRSRIFPGWKGQIVLTLSPRQVLKQHKAPITKANIWYLINYKPYIPNSHLHPHFLPYPVFPLAIKQRQQKNVNLTIVHFRNLYQSWRHFFKKTLSFFLIFFLFFFEKTMLWQGSSREWVPTTYVFVEKKEKYVATPSYLNPENAKKNLHLKMSSVYVVCWIFLQTF